MIVVGILSIVAVLLTGGVAVAWIADLGWPLLPSIALGVAVSVAEVAMIAWILELWPLPT